MKNIHKISAVDLFCGVGGLTYGLAQAGIDVKVGVDIDPQCKYAFEANNEAQFLEKSVHELKRKDINAFFEPGAVSLLAGCAPCQPFSRYSLAASNRMNPKWSLLHEFERLIKQVQPKLVTMENVPELRGHQVYKAFIEQLKRSKYHYWSEVVECQKYGIPQTRKRLVLLASKLGKLALSEPMPSSKTVRDAIEKLPTLGAGELDANDPMHNTAGLSPLNIKRISQSHPGGTWRDWDEDLVANCHKRDSGKTFSSVYGRMKWDQPAPTMTTQFYGYGNGRFGHPEQNRAISLREGAIFQSFPKNYKFVEPGQPVHRRVIGRLIGNAVPPQLGKVIGQTLIEHVAKFS